MTAVSDRHWMNELADHLRQARASHPDARFAVVFDIDGTIVDLRHTICYLLHRYDQERATAWFSRLRPDDVRHHENRIHELLDDWPLPENVRREAATYSQEHLWDHRTVLSGHRAYVGVMEAIRGLQLQARTDVAINTGRPERLRDVTRESLARLGRLHKVRFDPDLLFMCPPGREHEIADAKADALVGLRERGIVPVAVIDNEPENLAAVDSRRLDPAPLLLHADTIFESERPEGANFVVGDRYDLAELIGPGDLPDGVDLVWHGLNSESNLHAFLRSTIRWGECDVRLDAVGRLVARHDDYDVTPLSPDEPLLTFERVVDAVAGKHDGALKVDIKDRGAFDCMLDVVRDSGMPDGRLWFNAELEAIGTDAFCRLREEHPGAVVQCPGDFLAPLAFGAPDEARRVADELANRGISRLSVSWATPRLHELIDKLETWGHEINIYGVRNLETFLAAVLLLPRSVTADFNFPEWSMFGTGSGARETLTPA